MSKYVLYENDHILVTSDFIAQLVGNIVRVNSIELEFSTVKEAENFFQELTQKAKQVEEGKEASFIVRDRLLLYYGKVYELAANEINTHNGILYLTSPLEAKTVFNQLKESLKHLVKQNQGERVEEESLQNQGGGVGGSLYCQCITGKGAPTINLNPPQKGVFYIDEKNWEIWICIDNTPNKNKWKNIITGVIISPLEPILIKKNIQAPTKVQVNLPTATTMVFYGNGWTAGDYHYFFRAFNGSEWTNDAYYGNGFTVRQNCEFAYNYLDTPPSGKDLVAIFAWDSNGYEISFYEVNNGELGKEVYHKTGSIKWCGNVDNVCLYDDNCGSGSSLGGIIYVAEIYDKRLPHDKFAAAALKAIQDKDKN